MICELNNKMDAITDWIIFGDTGYISGNKEVGLGDFLLTLTITVLAIVFMSWWWIPVRIVLKALNRIQFEIEEE